MKILHINPYPLDHLGGSEIFCKNLVINLLKKKQIESDVLTSDIFKRKKKIDFLDSSIKIIYRNFYYNLWNKNPIVDVYSYLKENYHKYDIIHAHSYIFFTSLQCAFLRKLRKFPFVLHIHGGVSTTQALSLHNNDKFQLYFKNLIFDEVIGKFTIKSADAIISVSKKDLILLKKRHFLSSERNYYIPNGIDVNKFKNDTNIEKKYITFVGRLSNIKGIDIFIDFAKKLYRKDNSLNFLIVGSGPLLNLVKEAQKKIPIKYYPYYPYNKIENIYNKSKIIVLSSRFEGLPTTLLESLACETPIIANNVGGISEILKNNENGLLFQNLNNESAIKKILEILHDNNKLTKFGKKGRELIEKNFAWDIITDKIANVYYDLINN